MGGGGGVCVLCNTYNVCDTDSIFDSNQVRMVCYINGNMHGKKSLRKLNRV